MFLTADTAHGMNNGPWRWLLLGLLLIAKAGTDIPAEQSPAIIGFSSGRVEESGFCLQKNTDARKIVLNNHQNLVFHTFANSQRRL